MKRTASVLLFIVISLIFAAAAFPQKARRTTTIPTATVEDEFVQFQEFGGITDGTGGVLVRWQMRFETLNVGFNVYRVTAGGAVQVNPGLIPGSAIRSTQTTVYNEQYEMFDENGGLGAVYVIRCMALDGRTYDSTAFTTRFVKDFEAEAGHPVSYYVTALHAGNGNVEARRLELPAELKAIVAAHARVPDPATQLWVASQPGVKISVKRDGFYRVTRAQLEAAGFDVSGDSANWRLFLEGVEQAIIVGPGDEYIEFYGQSIDVRETDTRVYFLITGVDPGKRIGPKIVRPVGGNVISETYRVSAEKKERLASQQGGSGYVAKLQNGDAENYWGKIITQTPFTPSQLIPFTVTGLDTSAPRVTIRIKLHGLQGANHWVKAVVNGQEIGSIAVSFNLIPYYADLLVPTSVLVEGTNTLNLTERDSGRVSLFDSLSVRYSRKYVADQNKASFYTPGYRRVDLGGFTTPNIRVFDLTFDSDPALLTGLPIEENGGIHTVRIPSSRPMVLYAVEDSQVFTDAVVTSNEPSTLSSPANAAEFLIIRAATSQLIAPAEAWATYRGSVPGGSFSTKVVNVEDVFDEFNYGLHGYKGIQEFLRVAGHTWATPPKYVLLLGDASYDPRNYEGFGYLDAIPTRIVNLIFEESGSDDALTDFDHDGLADIPIGRVAVRTPAAANIVLAKTINFENRDMQSLDRGALFASDCPLGFDFVAMNNDIASRLPAGTSITHIKRCLPPPNPTNLPDPASPAALLAALNSGKFVVNYAGHGASGIWGSGQFFSITNVPQLTNFQRESVFTMLTCLNGFFFQPNRDSLSEVLVNSGNGGAVAAWASTTDTTPDYQLVMGRRFYQQIGLGNIKRAGDLVKDAKVPIGGSDVGYSWALIGDPALQVRP